MVKKVCVFFFIFLMVPVHGAFKFGLENISARNLQLLKGKNVGLVTNQTGIDQCGKRNIDLLRAKGIKIKKIFAPEHGFNGDIPAEKEVKDTVDTKTKIPIISLYKQWTGKKITAEILRGIDFIVVDFQHVGMRHFTYISTLFTVLKAASEYQKPVMVLDRPSPLGGCMEGPLVEAGLKTFFSFCSIPLRHGMTLAELARYYNRYELKTPVALHVAPMKDYRRNKKTSGIIATHLSPYIKSVDACHGYSFLGLLGEVRPFKTGRSTDYVFQCLALPDHVPFTQKQLSGLSWLLRQSGITVQPYTYQDTNWQKKKMCTGFKVHVDDIADFSSFSMILKLLMFMKKSGVSLTFAQAYDKKFIFDKAVGTTLVREYIQGKVTKKVLKKEVDNGLRQFFAKAKSCFLYEPYPKLVFVQ